MRFVFLNRSGLLHIPTRFGRIGGACTARTSVGAAAGAMIPKHASATGRNRPPTRPPPTRRVIFMNNCSDIHQLVGGAAESSGVSCNYLMITWYDSQREATRCGSVGVLGAA